MASVEREVEEEEEEEEDDEATWPARADWIEAHRYDPATCSAVRP
jgi:hypothetical protein